jgi:uncharacterized RDD family membrane protein YckC
MLDTVLEVNTPEGVALRLPAAGPVPRALAWAIDAGIRFFLLSIAAALLLRLGRTGQGLYLLLLFVVVWAYPIVFEGLSQGQTPGKRAMELRVIAADGAPIGWLAACVRNLMRTVDMLPFGYACGLLACWSDPWGRRLGDRVAGTMVVHAPRDKVRAAVVAEQVQAPAARLRPSEQAAIIAFSERRILLTGERQAELADLAQLVTEARGTAGVARLDGVANWLLGRR